MSEAACCSVVALAPRPSTSAAASSGSSGFGIGKMLNVAMAGSMLYQMGGQPWSVEGLLGNLRHMQPMQMMILFSMVSSLFS